jgi:hypothetical protein
MRRLKVLLLLLTVAIVVVSGFAAAALNANLKVVAVRGSGGAFYAETTSKVFSFQTNCRPDNRIVRIPISQSEFDRMLSLIKQPVSLVPSGVGEKAQAIDQVRAACDSLIVAINEAKRNPSSANTLVVRLLQSLFCQTVTNLGGTCSPSSPFSTVEIPPTLVGIRIVSYVIDLELVFSNRLPIEVVNVAGKTASINQTVDTAFARTSCDADCMVHGSLSIGYVSALWPSNLQIRLNLNIETNVPVGWGFPPTLWLKLGMGQTIIPASIEIVSDDGTVDLV